MMDTHTPSLSLLLGLALLTVSALATRSPPLLGQEFYMAAVVEFRPNMTLEILHVPTREEAVQLMMSNLHSFEDYVKEGRDKGADIIVFPEYAIYGFAFPSRKVLYPFLEVIPDPREGRYTPCLDPDFGDRPILTYLSCLAHDYEIVLVANMGDKQRCENNSVTDTSSSLETVTSECPPDGWYIYNTNVVFDSDGSLLAKYHKTHLYAGEALIFNTPTPTPHISFKTSFGVTFGTFTCYDILYCDPPLELLDMGIRNFVFPTAWGNSYPFYTSIAFQQAWSWRTGANFLAANQHFPNNHSFPVDIRFYLTGSGIYSAGNALRTFISGENYVPATGQLVLATLPKEPPQMATHTGEKKTAMTCPARSESKVTDPVHIDTDIEMKSNTYLNFTALSDELNGTVMALYTNSDAHLSLHCSLDYYKTANTETETYALGAYIGGSKSNQELLFGVCSLVKCPSRDLTTCGSPVEGYVAETVFEGLELSGSFPTGSTVFPVVQLSKLELVSPAHVELGEKEMVIGAVGKPLLSASLWTRVQPRSPNTYHCPNSKSH